MVQDPFGHAGLEHRVGGVDAHAAGVGAGVALADAFVVLRGNQRGHVFAVGQAEKADLVAFEELLDDDLLLGCAQQRAVEQALRGFKGDAARLADNDALAGGQPIGLDHDGRMEELDGLFQLRCTGADRVVGGGDVVSLHELLGESLARFQHGRGLGGTKDAQSALLQRIHNAKREGQLGADNGQVGLLGVGQAHHGIAVLQVHWNAARDLGNAAITRRANDLSDSCAALYCPGQCVFAASGTQDQDFHCCAFSPKGYGPQWGGGKSNREVCEVAAPLY